MVIWLVILAVMILVEVITMGLTTIWFALGSLGAVVAVATGYISAHCRAIFQSGKRKNQYR